MFSAICKRTVSRHCRFEFLLVVFAMSLFLLLSFGLFPDFPYVLEDVLNGPP